MSAPKDPVAAVQAARYVLLTTFRRDGTPVPTPVWAVPVQTASGPGIRVWTGATSGKVKRIRVGSRVEVTPSSMRGAPRGQTLQGAARLLDAAETATILDAIRRKYRLLGPILARRSRHEDGSSIGIEIALTAP